MNKKSLKTLVLITLPIILFSIVSCEKETVDPAPTKSLNKTLLAGKKWYNQGSTNTHDIRSNGVYGAGGTWEWKSVNSDTMKIDFDGTGSTFQPEFWKFFWSAEHEMACKKAGSGSGEILYKDQAW